jgi:hypothetical protein
MTTPYATNREGAVVPSPVETYIGAGPDAAIDGGR